MSRNGKKWHIIRQADVTEKPDNIGEDEGFSAHRFSVAPMMDWTDRHCRIIHRLMSRHARLYSEMVTAQAVIHGNRDRLIGFDALEHPLALQLGGNDPMLLAQAARIGADFGYDEINLNCGCPSDRVQGGAFGACLMREPALVGDCVAAMKAAVSIPVTVKCRIGVDDQDPEAALDALTASVRAAGVDALIVHARKAWLQGLSPKENREIPPLDYERAYRLKAANRELPVSLNGGIKAPAEWAAHLAHLDGVMVGREAYQNPEILLQVDSLLFGQPAPVADAFAMLEALEPHIARHIERGGRLHAFTRHLVGLFPGRKGARQFRRHLAEHCVKADATLADLRAAAAHVSRHEAQAA
ncbi:MAG: tRNA dihydrouridine(20/20a) synthase DusA [Bosea sp. (in: a-proteobacteria)]|nr:MAG: tRNA dihydrouridine(20/20a) synthase DusA [Bosea sp. (in: a-proteobacteria)]